MKAIGIKQGAEDFLCSLAVLEAQTYTKAEVGLALDTDGIRVGGAV